MVMPDDETLQAIIEETERHSAREAVTPDQHQRLKDAVFSEQFRKVVMNDLSYFVLGSYDGGEKEARLVLVRNTLKSRGTGYHAFLMRELPDAWEFWTTKFKILAKRATYIVGVFEDSHGSYQWESGYLDQPVYREKSHILKRDHATSEEEYAAFTAMMADCLQILDRMGQVSHWATESELREKIADVPR
jgi:hypothetical protein